MDRPHRRLGADEDPRWPIGMIWFNVDEREFHFDPGAEDWSDSGRTLCGQPTGEIDSRIGTYGIPLSKADVRHGWLEGRTPCKGCFIGDWWKREGN